MAAGSDDIRGLIHSQGTRIPHLPRSAAALSWQITAHVSKALSLDPEPGRKPARALGAWDHCLHGKLVFPGAAGCIVTITSGLLASAALRAFVVSHPPPPAVAGPSPALRQSRDANDCCSWEGRCFHPTPRLASNFRSGGRLCVPWLSRRRCRSASPKFTSDRPSGRAVKAVPIF